MKLPIFLSSILTAAFCCANAYAVVKSDGVDYTLSDNGEGAYNATATVGTGVNTTYVSGTYASTFDSVDSTPINDVTVTMTGGSVNSIMTAGDWLSSPIDGDVKFDISGGYVGALYGGNWMSTALTPQYGSGANIDSVTINIGGNAYVGTVIGGSIVSGDAGAPTADFIQKFTTTGDVSINVKGDAVVGNIYACYNYHDKIDGNLAITFEGASVSNLFGCYVGNVTGDVELSINDGTVYWANLLAGGTVGGDISLTLNGGHTTYAYGMSAGTLGGNLSIVCDGGSADYLHAVTSGTASKDVAVVVEKGKVGYLAAVTDGEVKGDVSVTTNGGEVGTIIAVSGGVNEYGPYGGKVAGDIAVTINDGQIGNIYANKNGQAQGNLSLDINGGTVTGTACAASEGHVEGDVTVKMTGGTTTNLYAANTATVGGNTTIYLLGGTVTDYVYGGDASKVAGTRTLYVGSDTQAYNGTVGSYYGFDSIVIAAGSTLTTTFAGDGSYNYFEALNHSYTLSEQNVSQAVATTNGDVFLWDADTLTLNLSATGTMKSGRYMLIDASNGTVWTDNWTAEKVIVKAEGFEASFEDLAWENNVLVFYYRGKEADTTLSSNWGAFKSSQAFVNTLRGSRNNYVVIPSRDEKGYILDKGYTLAWGSAYCQSARISGIGADYSIFGAAVGAEHHFVSGRSIGVAMGYDWGKVSPFNMSSIDQDSAHLALYGRAADWKLSQKGAIVLDWSVAVSNTTSETDGIDGDWSQKNLQLDARVSYQHELSDKTTGYAFAGVQYYAAEDATAGHVQVSSMQNLRTEIGAGAIYKATQKTTLHAEASVYNDAMRHNPFVTSNGASFYGTNPGRFGGSVETGINYQLNAKWNVYGNYSFELADDSTEHNVNVGASYQF